MQKYTALEKFSLIDPILKDDLTTTQVEVTFGIPARTLRCWKKQFLTEGLPGLERKKRNDKGKHRRIREELIQLIKALALQRPPLSIKAIQRKVAIIAQRQSSKPPAYGTIYGVVKRAEPRITDPGTRRRKALQAKV